MCPIEKELKAYVSGVRKNLVCRGKDKKMIINDIRNSVFDYAEEKCITDINDIYSHFGTPEEIAKQYLPETDIRRIKHTRRFRRIIIPVCVIAGIILTLVFIKLISGTRITTIIMEDGVTGSYYYNGLDPVFVIDDTTPAIND